MVMAAIVEFIAAVAADVEDKIESHQRVDLRDRNENLSNVASDGRTYSWR